MKWKSWIYKTAIGYLWMGMVMSYAYAAPVAAIQQQAVDIFAVLDQKHNYIESLSTSGLNELPVGMSRTVSNVNYSIAVSSIRFLNEYAELTLWGRVKVPQSDGSDNVLFFGAEGVKLSHTGDIVGDATLVLLGDREIPICGGSATLTLKGGLDVKAGISEKLTYMSVDCRGFKELGLTADLTFSDALIQKVDENGKCNPADSRVTASFSTVVENWNDIVLDLSLPRFEVVGLKDFIFDARNVVFDFSDKRNVAGIHFPVGYEEEYMIPGNPDLWKGVYIGDLNVVLPPQFKSRQDSSKRISFSTHDMLFDQNGITGIFEAENILLFENGSAGGWPFSVEKFSLELVANNLRGAGFGGMIGIPVAHKSPLKYDAYISPDNEYLMKITTTETMNFSIWAAEAEILPNSYVQLKVKDGKFRPEAMLSGSMSIKAAKEAGGDGKSIAELNGIKFQRLNLKTEAPYFMVDYLGYDGEVSLNNFPLSISKIALQTKGMEACLGFDVKIALGTSPFDLKADTRLEVIGEMKPEKGLQSWKYKKINIAAIKIEAEMAEAFQIKGSVALLNDDPIYGDGFAGSVDLSLQKCMEGVSMKARAVFGKKDFRYWLVDGSMVFGKMGVPIIGPVHLNGIGGGAYYRMAQRGVGESVLPSGTVYVPDEKRGLGLKAAVMLNIGGPKVISGEASFEIAFNNKGGLAYMGFFGQAKVLGEIAGLKKLENAVKSRLGDIANSEEKYLKEHPGLEAGLDKLQKYKLYSPTDAAKDVFPAEENLGGNGFLAALGIQYDFTQQTLHANLDLYVNVLGGLIKGRGQNNRAGYAVMHIEKGNWYLHLGTPANRLGIELDLLNLIKIKSGAYFMTGSELADAPAPPQQVADILGMELRQLDYMREMNTLKEGKGFAFGADFSVATGDISFLILYANFQAGLGFDIMMKDYGQAQCNGHSGPVGIDGWYANGQAYAYLQGEAGVKINLLFIKKKIPIIKAGAATLFQAKLPNPSWFVGYLGMKIDILGGLVKGHMRLKIKLGEECELVVPGSSPIDVPVISDMKPENGTNEIDVFAAPQVAFNLPIGKSFYMEDVNNNIQRFQLTLDEYTITDENNKPIEGRMEWNAKQDLMTFYSREILPPSARLKVFACVGFQEWRNGHWEIVYTGGLKAQEKMEISFTTGEAPDNIPMQNIAYCYPVVDQRYFLQKEGSQGYIQLKRGQSYLFTAGFRYQAQFVAAEGREVRAELRYNAGLNRLYYDLPALEKETAYTLKMLASVSEAKTENNPATRDQVQVGTAEDEVTISNARASDVIQQGVGKVLVEYDFATSRYLTLKEKFGGIVKKQASDWREGGYLFLEYFLSDTEPFDVVELVGNEYSGYKPLIHPEATLEDPFYRNEIYPLIYQHYPYPDRIRIRYRDPAVLGVPPVRAVPVSSEYLSWAMSGNSTGNVKRYFPYTYSLMSAYSQDFYDLRNQVVNTYLNRKEIVEFDYIVNGRMPVLPTGTYKVNFRYVQPDDTKGSSCLFNYDFVY